MEKRLLTLDHIEYYCRANEVLVKGRTKSGQDLTVSPVGPHSQDLSYEQVNEALVGIKSFELKKLFDGAGEVDISYFVTRFELENEVQKLIH